MFEDVNTVRGKTAGAVERNPFLLHWWKVWDGEYGEWLKNDKVLRNEDRRLRSLIARNMMMSGELVDFGCGDGLVRRLVKQLPNQHKIRYVGVDPIDTYVNPETGGPFVPQYVMTADEYMNTYWWSKPDLVVFAFSAEDCGAKSVMRAVDQSKSAIVTFKDGKGWKRPGINPVVAWLKMHLYYFPQARKIKKGLKRRGFVIEKLAAGGDYYVGYKKP